MSASIRELEGELYNKEVDTVAYEYDDRQIEISEDTDAIVIVGAGPVGMRLVSELVSLGVETPVIVYGGEPVQPYNRVKLSDYLAGNVYRDEIYLHETRSTAIDIEYRYNCEVESINRSEKTVTDASGRVQHYKSLVLATGSSPFMPKFGNRHYEGVYTFRTLSEADKLLSRNLRTRHTVVIGGGLLGLETARAMQKHHTRITVVEHNSWLMMQQLDEDGAACLQNSIEDSGVDVVLSDSVIGITGNGRVEGVTLRSGKTIECDTVIVAAGIRSNISLALDAGLVCHRGIKVDNSLTTSDPDIYAIGECAQYKEIVYGLVRPGYEQAAVLANHLTGGSAQYTGSVSATQLKVMSMPVFSAGRTGVDEASRTTVSEYVYRDDKAGVYRKIRVFGNRIVGAVSVGGWHEAPLLNDAIEEKRHIWFWQLVRFKHHGYLWGSEEESDVNTWPAQAVVCNCNSVSRGRLSNAIDSGCNGITCLTNMTGAGGVCGSCKPLLSEMLGSDETREPALTWKSLLTFAGITAVIIAMFLLVTRIPYSDSVDVAVRWDELWRDGLFKQISGFTILGLVAVGLLVSIRKRVEAVTAGKFDYWRVAHIALGVLALLVLVAHTGFRLGNQLNMMLMLNFLLLAAIGAYAGRVIAVEHRMTTKQARKQRRLWNGLHIYLVWSFPVLLGFHVLKTYYF